MTPRHRPKNLPSTKAFFPLQGLDSKLMPAPPLNAWKHPGAVSPFPVASPFGLLQGAAPTPPHFPVAPLGMEEQNKLNREPTNPMAIAMMR